MREKIDTEALLRSVNIVDVIGRRVTLKKEGAEHVGLCPFHDDHRGSLKVNERKQIYKCFACDAGGDALDFLQRGGQTFHEACEELQGKHGHFAPAVQHTPEPDPKQPAVIIQPVPADAPEPSSKKKLQTDRGEEWGRFIKRWAYRDERGQLLGYTARFEDAAGQKQVFPQVYVEREGKRYWSWKGFPTPRPLYRLDQLAKRPGVTVLIVEGEKTADAAAKLFPHVCPVTWMGGAQGIKHADWQPLAGRNVLIWPDNDQPGCDAAAAIAEILRPIAGLVKFVQPPSGPKGWDVADASWTPEEAKAYAKANVTDTVPVPTHPAPEPPPPPAAEPAPAAPAGLFAAPLNPSPEPATDHFERPYFKFLGFEKVGGNVLHVFYQDATKLVIKAPAGGIGKSLMMQLNPDPLWWQTWFGAEKKSFNAEKAQAWMLQRSHETGMFDRSRVRGRGAWLDDKRVVLHLGNTLVVDGQTIPIEQLRSDYTYEQSTRMKFAQAQPATKEQAARLFEVLHLINWERPVSAPLLAGWCVVAPLCGALTWRPHIWITGGSGTGKSWVVNQIVKPLLGETVVDTQGDTSEAGLRQFLVADALPVVFDEADVDEQKDSDRIQKVLALMRSSSTGGSGKILKGSANGDAKGFETRSCFALASIAMQASKQADQTRVTVLGINREPNHTLATERFSKLIAKYNEIFTPEFIAGIQSRTTRMLPIIMQNAKTCAVVADEVLGFRRTGDQLGILIAGALSLTSDGLVSAEAVKEWILKQDWTDERGHTEQRDELRLLQLLLEQSVTVEALSGRFTRSIGELLRIATGLDLKDDQVSVDLASKSLRRYGFRVDFGPSMRPDTFFVSNDHDWIAQRLRNTPWSKGWSKILVRLDGARPAEKTLRFSGAMPSRAVEVPVTFIE